MNYTFAATSITGFVIAGGAAMFVFARNPREKLNQLFFAYATAVAWFNLTDFLFLISRNAELADFYNHLSVSFWLLFIVFLLHFCLVLAKEESPFVRQVLLPLLYVSIVLVAYLNFITHWIYTDPVMTRWGYQVGLGEWYWLFVTYSLFFVLVELGLLRQVSRGARTRREKGQARTLFWALLAATALGVVFDVLFPLIGIRFPSMVPLATTIFVLLFGYTMFRYGFLVVSPAALAQNIIGTMPGYMIFTDPQDKVVMVNPSYLNVSGFSVKEAVGRRFIDLHGHNHAEEHEAYLADLERNGAVKGTAMWLKKKGGDKLPVEMSAALVRDQFGDEVGRLYIFRDILEERKLLDQQKAVIEELGRNKERMLSILEDTTAARDEVKKLYEDLKVVDKMKTEFLSMISHELRTPMTPIKGYAEMLLSGAAGELPELVKKAVGIIKKEGDHLLNLIDSILDVSRLERGVSMELKNEPISMKVLLDDLREVLGSELENRGIKLEAGLSPDFPTLTADPSKLHRLLTNLLGNAMKFTPRGGWIRVVGSRKDDTAQVEVIDNGIGIAKENLDKIFDRFYQVDSSYTRAAGGAGLGLAVAKEIVEAHGGKIRAESEGLGKGTKIIFTLPIGGG